MSTLLGSPNSRKTGPRVQPEHPVDAALWGLAQRLTETPTESSATEEAVPADPELRRSAEFQATKVRVVRLPQRGGGLPSVGRMSQRGTRTELQPEGVPTKPAVEEPAPRQRKTAKKTPTTARPPQTESTVDKPAVRRAEFTILKGRTDRPRDQTDGRSPKVQSPNQDSRISDEPSTRSRTTARRRRQRPRAGVTIVGWLALFALSAVAAAIALLAPPWF